MGWRLPSVVELKSVQDPSSSAPFVLASVFTGVQSAGYWSATTGAGDPSSAWQVQFFLLGGMTTYGKFQPAPVWCVRGPMQESVY